MCNPNSLKIIARAHSDFPTKFGIPRQSGMIDELKSQIVFEPEFRDESAVRGLESFSHIWIIWGFSEARRKDGAWSPTVRPPRLGGNTRVGVFATRSPFRPNSIGLSCARLDKIEFVRGKGAVLHVSGADLMDGTPIYDIKPYLPYTDCRPDAVGGFADDFAGYALDVIFPQELLDKIPQNLQSAICRVLAVDPRPAYQSDPERVYGFQFGGFEVKFSVDGDVLTVKDVEKL